MLEPSDEFHKTILKLSSSLEKYLNIHAHNCPDEEVIKSLADLSFRLVNRMHTYDTVLTDDPSGRLVGIYLLEQIKRKKRSLGLLPNNTIVWCCWGKMSFYRTKGGCQ